MNRIPKPNLGNLALEHEPRKIENPKMRISIVCPVYNAHPEDLLGAVRSILDQPRSEACQVILVDDGSTSSSTHAAIHALKSDERVFVIRSAGNTGPASARNIGLDHVTGDWIGFLDADDRWSDSRVADSEEALHKNPTATWLIADCAELGISGTIIAQPTLTCFASGRPKGRKYLTKAIITHGLHLGACLIRSNLLAPPRRFNPRVRYGEDILFLAKLSTMAYATHVPSVGYVRRRQRTSMMWSKARLTGAFASGPRAGLRDGELKPFRREYRWALYAVLKDLAVNNLINGRRVKALRFAAEALARDPREIQDFFLLLKMIISGSHTREKTKMYSGCEKIILDKNLDLKDTY